MQVDIVEARLVAEREDIPKMPFKGVRDVTFMFAMEEVVELPFNWFLCDGLHFRRDGKREGLGNVPIETRRRVEL